MCRFQTHAFNVRWMNLHFFYSALHCLLQWCNTHYFCQMFSEHHFLHCLLHTLPTLDWPCLLWTDIAELGLILLIFDKLYWPWTDLDYFWLNLLTFNWPWQPWTDLDLTLLTLDDPCITWMELADLGWTMLTLEWPCLGLTLLTLDWPCRPSWHWTYFADHRLTLGLPFWPWIDFADILLTLLDLWRLWSSGQFCNLAMFFYIFL